MTKCFLHPWPVVSAPFRCSWQSLVTEEQFTNKSLACKCSILAVFIPYQLLVLFTAKVISWNCSGKVPNGCDSTCGSMHFLWVQMCLGCMVFCRKARTTPKVVWKGLKRCHWGSGYPPLVISFQWLEVFVCSHPSRVFFKHRTDGRVIPMLCSKKWGTEEWLQLAKHLIYDSQMVFIGAK